MKKIHLEGGIDLESVDARTEIGLLDLGKISEGLEGIGCGDRRCGGVGILLLPGLEG